MRSALLVTAIIACACAHAMPLGLRTAMWGVARAGGAAADAEDDPIPELPPSASSSEVADALSGSVDAGLVANIVSGEVYVAYHGWVQDVTNATAASAVAIKGSPHAWLSFALGADALIEGELTSDDVKIESFTPSAVDGFRLTTSTSHLKRLLTARLGLPQSRQLASATRSLCA